MDDCEGIENLKQKYICLSCVDDLYLKKEITNNGHQSICSYCGSNEKSLQLIEISHRVEIAFEQHYQRTSNEPEGWQARTNSDPESSYE